MVQEGDALNTQQGLADQGVPRSLHQPELLQPRWKGQIRPDFGIEHAEVGESQRGHRTRTQRPHHRRVALDDGVDQAGSIWSAAIRPRPVSFWICVRLWVTTAISCWTRCCPTSWINSSRRAIQQRQNGEAQRGGGHQNNQGQFDAQACISEPVHRMLSDPAMRMRLVYTNSSQCGTAVFGCQPVDQGLHVFGPVSQIPNALIAPMRDLGESVDTLPVDDQTDHIRLVGERRGPGAVANRAFH